MKVTTACRPWAVIEPSFGEVDKDTLGQLHQYSKFGCRGRISTLFGWMDVRAIIRTVGKQDDMQSADAKTKYLWRG
jgi:hypothetical protein